MTCKGGRFHEHIWKGENFAYTYVRLNRSDGTSVVVRTLLVRGRERVTFV
jgi:hypothetical protein